MNFSEIYEQAVYRHQAGDLQGASELYRRVLEIEPAHGDSLNLLGVLARQQGQLDESERNIRQAISLDGKNLNFRFNLAETLRASGQLDEAIGLYRQVLAADGHRAPVWHAMGVVLERTGHDHDALAAYRKAVAEEEHLIPAWESLVAALWRKQMLDEAAAASRALIAAAPPDATRFCRHASILLQVGDLAQAIEAYNRAVQLKPESLEPWIGLANCYYRLGRLVDSAKAARQAALVSPRSARAHISLGLALEKLGRNAEAVEMLSRAAELDPKEPLAHGNLAKSLLDRFQVEQAIQTARRAVELAPQESGWHSNLLLMLNLPDGIDDRELFDEHRRWAAIHARALEPAQAQLPRDPDPDRPLRIGYLSADFRLHPVLSFFEPIVDGHDRLQYQPILYSNVARPDAATARLREMAGAEYWRDVSSLSDRQLAGLIERDRVDILVDLSGHSAGNRLLLMARACAPVQVTYLGYPNTTGLSQSIVHYRLTDEFCDPPGLADEIHSERLIRLPGCFVCFRPNPDSPDVAPAPVLASGFVTFGSFCAMMKISPRVIETWSAILRIVDNARFLLKNRAMDDPEVRLRVADAFAAHGINSSRLILLGQDASPVDHLARYSQIDIALDTFPYNGTTTTCEALWMGVPVLTWAGSSHRKRVGSSLLRSAGMADLVAQSIEQYVNMAVDLSGDVKRLSQLRSAMRMRLTSSPWRSESRFVTNLEAAYRRLWRDVVR